ncbi:acyl carrier protein [Amycolatopsis sp. NPDC051716]|jgi:acyl carrier protein|uniref:acyl carrier protein n=1 Tax=Amycolatopsis sp. NPDC051716 TaxID=3155804 RepID=UPI00343129BE
MTDTLARTVADVLGVPATDVLSADSLFDLPGFDSIAIVSVLERLEDDLGVEVPAERIVPEAFESLPALRSLLAAALPEGAHP